MKNRPRMKDGVLYNRPTSTLNWEFSREQRVLQQTTAFSLSLEIVSAKIECRIGALT